MCESVRERERDRAGGEEGREGGGDGGKVRKVGVVVGGRESGEGEGVRGRRKLEGGRL